MPWLRYAKKYSLRLFISTQRRSGTYDTVIVAKSGWPVTGQTLVNSGNTNLISYSRPGRGLSNVSRMLRGSSTWSSVRPRRRPSSLLVELRDLKVGGVCGGFVFGLRFLGKVTL